MPFGDGSGPNGFGPRTGRAIGFCTGYNFPGYQNPDFRKGFGRRAGRGLYRRLCCAFEGMTPVSSKLFLTRVPCQATIDWRQRWTGMGLSLWFFSVGYLIVQEN